MRIRVRGSKGGKNPASEEVGAGDKGGVCGSKASSTSSLLCHEVCLVIFVVHSSLSFSLSVNVKAF